MKNLLRLLLLLAVLGTTACGAGHEIERQYPFGYGPGNEYGPGPDPRDDEEYYDTY